MQAESPAVVALSGCWKTAPEAAIQRCAALANAHI